MPPAQKKVWRDLGIFRSFSCESERTIIDTLRYFDDNCLELPECQDVLLQHHFQLLLEDPYESLCAAIRPWGGFCTELPFNGAAAPKVLTIYWGHVAGK